MNSELTNGGREWTAPLSDALADGKRMVELCGAYGTLHPFMVVVAQLVEHQFVVLRVAGSSPVDHPKASRLGGRTSLPLHCSPLRL